MALKLNATREAYREFYGRNTEQMPKLIADGRVPMNVAQLMQRRLDVRNSNSDIKSSYLNNWFDTGDAVVYHPDGRVKIVLDSEDLRNITPDSKLRSGALILTEDIYNNLQGEEFKKGKLGKINEWLSREAVKFHPVWKVLARDQGLLNDYADLIFAEGNHDKAMGIFPSSAQGRTPELRAWYVDRLEYMSLASGGVGLDYDDGRFVGIVPDSAFTQNFDKAIKSLEGVLNSKLLKPFTQLGKKL